MRRRETGRPGGAGPSQRQLRVGEELRHALVEILREGHARDPELRNANVTVTEVRVSPDLTNATAFVMTLGGVHADETVAALNRAAPYFRTQLAHAVQLRHAPRVSFALDTSFLHGARITELLNEPAVKRDLIHDPDA
jgi:ribosome-binding factor A